MSLNSNIFIPKGLPVTERARLLGHSVETNLKRYSFAGKGNIADICELLVKCSLLSSKDKSMVKTICPRFIKNIMVTCYQRFSLIKIYLFYE